VARAGHEPNEQREQEEPSEQGEDERVHTYCLNASHAARRVIAE
jgi:hypothetical protein